MPLRLVFLGSDPIALPLLDWLAGEGRVVAKIVAVFTQPDRPVGRGQKVQPNTIKTWALDHGLPVHQPERLMADARTLLAELAPDVSLVMAYGHILHEDFIAAARLGTLNLHASLLPKYRGASPIQTAVASGEHETGVSLMRIVRELDAGPVAGRERVAIEPNDTALDVEARLAAASVTLLARALPRLAAGTLAFTEQEHAAATFCRRLTKDDGALDFSAPAAALAARINGLFPWPACAAEVAGQPIKFGLADIVAPVADRGSGNTTAPGTVLGADGAGLLVAAGAEVLRVLRLQRPGGKMLPAAEFLRGFPVAAGTMLPSRPLPVLVANEPFRHR
ncbi:MAG TPA: methionyl-tRNA formyltransferase [Opitutaceae bacterium]|nr:methionyl-tRNA formyltransferase [Opitutaceae bacterium]